MTTTPRPLSATVLALLFAVAAALMFWLALDAYAYFIPVVPLAACAGMLWRGCGLTWFKRVLELNQLTAIVLILDLWLGDMLHLPKLTISAAMLGLNLVLGGPLLGILAIVSLAAMHFAAALPAWLKGVRA